MDERRFDSAISRYLETMKELLNTTECEFAKPQVAIPEEGGVYIIHDNATKDVIYVGRTKNLHKRLLSHHRRGNIKGSQFRKALARHSSLKTESEISEYVLANCSFRFMPVEDFENMVRLEHFTTAILGPILNVKLKH